MERNAAQLGPVPIVLGVTGHRDIDENSIPLRTAVRGLLATFAAKYPTTRIVVLSALAEGADRLVAREALDAGCVLIAPLPLAADEYERDFGSAQSRDEFRELLSRAKKSFVVSAPPEASIDGVLPRDVAYANCGAYIVRSCMELIAIWDGTVGGPHGGTASVVDFQLNGIPSPYLPEYRAFDPALTGPVLHVPAKRGVPGAAAASPEATPAVAAAASPEATPAVKTLFPDPAVIDFSKAYDRAKADIERFNNDAVAGPFSGAIATLTTREQAERLAGIFARRTSAALISILTLVFFAVVGFNVYTTLPTHPLFLLITYLTCTAAAFVPFLLSRRGDWQIRYQDYRALEELLRTAQYWRLAGIDRSVSTRLANADRTKIDWLAFALRALQEPPVADVPDAPEPLTKQRLQTVYDQWVMDQQRYFTIVAGRRDRRRRSISTRLATTLVVVSVGLTIGTQIASSFSLLHSLVGILKIDTILLFVATMLAIGAAIVNDYADKRGWSEHSRHYDMMAALFGYAAERIAPILAKSEFDDDDRRNVRAILANLGDEAIRENAAWLNLHRSRPLNVPRL